MHDKLTEWRRRRSEEAAKKAADSASYFEQHESAELSAAAERAMSVGGAAIKEHVKLCDQARKYGEAAAEHQQTARQATLDYQQAARRGQGERKTAINALKEAAAAWSAAAAEAQKETDAWKAAVTELWKTAAATTECINVTKAAVAIAKNYAGEAQGNDRKTAATRLKSAKEWAKSMKEWADPHIEKVSIFVEDAGQRAALAAAWAAGAAAMAAGAEEQAAAEEEDTQHAVPTKASSGEPAEAAGADELGERAKADVAGRAAV